MHHLAHSVFSPRATVLFSLLSALFDCPLFATATSFGNQEGITTTLGMQSPHSHLTFSDSVVLTLHTPKVAGSSMIKVLRSISKLTGMTFLARDVYSTFMFMPKPCSILKKYNIKLMSDEIGLPEAMAIRGVIQSCAPSARLGTKFVGFFRQPLHTTISAFVQVLHNLEDLRDDHPGTVLAIKMLDQGGKLEFFLRGKLCNYKREWCPNIQSHYLGLLSRNPVEAVRNNSIGSMLTQLDTFGIVEAFEVSICLIAYDLAGGRHG